MMRNSLLILPLLLLSACSSPGGIFARNAALEVHSLGMNRVRMNVNYSTIVSTAGFANEGDIWMTDIPLDQLIDGNPRNGQIIHIQVLWTPVAGKTPLASSSTNMTVKLIIIADGEVGVYGGGGYCWKNGEADQGLHLLIEEATIAIQEQSPRFLDLLTPASMTGYIPSVPDPSTARQIANAANRIAS